MCSSHRPSYHCYSIPSGYVSLSFAVVRLWLCPLNVTISIRFPNAECVRSSSELAVDILVQSSNRPQATPGCHVEGALIFVLKLLI